MPSRRIGQLLRQAALSRTTRLLLGLASAVFIAAFAINYRAELAATLRKADIALFATAVVLGITSNFLTGLPFRHFLGQYGVHATWVQSGRLQLIAQVAKYVPGKVWGAVLQTQASRSNRLDAFFLAGVDNSLFQVVVLSALGMAILLSTALESIWIAAATSLSGLFLAALLASAGLLARSVRWLTGRLAGTAAHEPQFVRFVVAGAIFATVQFLSLLVVLKATMDLGGSHLMVATSCALLAWVLGTLAFVFPSGLGVREAAFVALASSLGVPAELSTLAAAALAIRASQLIQDMLTAVLVGPSLLAAEPSKQGH